MNLPSHTCPGQPEDTLLLIHGMAANRAVWEPMLPLIQRDWPGRCLAPDLRGHGGAPQVGPYGFGQFAADLAALVPAGGRLAIIGHSLGGVVGALMGSGWFGVRVHLVTALAVKTVWTEGELDKARALATAPVRWFERRDEAVQRYLRVSGLDGLVAPDSSVAQAGVREHDDRFRLACDPGVYGASAPGVETIMRGANCPLHLVAGGDDTIVSAEHLRTLDPDLSLLPGLGHNLHVQDPQAAWEVFRSRWARVCVDDGGRP